MVSDRVGPTVEVLAIKAAKGGAVVNVPSLVVVCPSAFVATTSKWYVAPGMSPLSPAENGPGSLPAPTSSGGVLDP